MQLNIKFNDFGSWKRILACALWIALSQTVVHAQLGAEMPVAVEPVLESYRDGERLISVERQLSTTLPTQAVLLHTGGRVFHAGIDRHAIVQLAQDADPAVVWKRAGLQPLRALSAGVYLVAADSGEDGVQIASRLAHVAGIEEAVPDLRVLRQRQRISVPPNDPRYSGQWYLKTIDIESAWRHSTGTRDTTVVVIDDGCDLKHADLMPNMLEGLDVIDQDNDPSYAPNMRGNSHGTACAGLIAAAGDNEIGIAGACPECTLRCVRLLGADDQGILVSQDLQAFNFAMTTGASVVSNSWGFAEPMPVPAPLRNLLVRLYTEGRNGRGTLVLFAAGNEDRELGNEELMGTQGVITIGAINNFDEAAAFSNRGPSLYLTAPAGTLTTDITGADGDVAGDYTSLFGGTSSACPVAAGIVGLVMSAKPELSATEVRELLRATAREAPYSVPDADGHDDTYGYGIIDPGAAVRRALGIEDPSDAGTAEPGGSDASTGGARDAGVAAHGGSGGEQAGSSAGHTTADPDPEVDAGSVSQPTKKSDDSGCSLTGMVARDGGVGWTFVVLALVSVSRLRRTRRDRDGRGTA